MTNAKKQMITPLTTPKKEVADKDFKVNCEGVRCSLELSSQPNPIGRAQAIFLKAFDEAKRDMDEAHWAAIHTARSLNRGGPKWPPKFVLEGESRANWVLTIFQRCIVRSVQILTQLFRRLPGDLSLYAWLDLGS